MVLTVSGLIQLESYSVILFDMIGGCASTDQDIFKSMCTKVTYGGWHGLALAPPAAHRFTPQLRRSADSCGTRDFADSTAASPTRRATDVTRQVFTFIPGSPFPRTGAAEGAHGKNTAAPTAQGGRLSRMAGNGILCLAEFG